MSDTAPDVPGVVVGWRTWRIRGPGRARLRSPLQVFTEWPPGEALTARCELMGHPAPDPDCTCGLYAVQEPADVGGIGYGGVTLLGCVALWGTVVEGERGWRGGIGRPVVLFCGPALSQPVRAELTEAYGIPVHPLGRPVAPAVELPGIGATAERLRTAAAAAPPDPRRIDAAARAFVDATTPVDQAVPPLRGPRRAAIGTALLTAVAASALLLPPAESSAPLAPTPPARSATPP